MKDYFRSLFVQIQYQKLEIHTKYEQKVIGNCFSTPIIFKNQLNRFIIFRSKAVFLNIQTKFQEVATKGPISKGQLSKGQTFKRSNVKRSNFQKVQFSKGPISKGPIFKRSNFQKVQ